MKLLRTHVRVNPNDSLGQGLDAVITLVVFFAIGFFVDRWLGTTPWFMVGLSVLGALGVFYKLKRGYESRMDQHERQRLAARADKLAATTETATTETATTEPSAHRETA